jgi:hypothetical protein
MISIRYMQIRLMIIKRSFQLLDGLNIEPAVNIRNNTHVKTKQNITISIKKRREEVLLIKKL